MANMLTRFFGLKKGNLNAREKEIIKLAYEQVLKGSFENLDFDSSNYSNFKSIGYTTQKEAFNGGADAMIKEFLKSYNYLAYVILNSEKLYNLLKNSSDKKVLEAIGGFVTIEYRIKNKEYLIRRKSGNKYYPEAICYDTPERTKEYYLMLLKPLLQL
ncbi:MAG: hypothetical protein ACP5OA_05670 [Candidatus Woesearchaeota archaeon]